MRYSFALLEIQIVDNKTSTPLHAANFGAGGHDLLDVCFDIQTALQTAGGRTTKDRHLIPEAIDLLPAWRQLRVEFDYGHYGHQRRVRNASSGTQTGAVDPGEVAADPLRSLLSVPKNGTVALLAIECAGLASAVGMLSPIIKSGMQDLRQGCRADIRAVEETAAWEAYIRGADLVEVEFQYRRQPKDNRSGRPVVERFGLRAEGGEFLPKAWIDRLRRRRLGADDVLTVDVPDGDADQTVLVLNGDGRRRTLRLDGGLPKFTWQVGEDNQRPDDGEFYVAAEEVINQELARSGTDPTAS